MYNDINISSIQVHSEDVFSTAPIDDLFLETTARVIESEILSSVTFIDSTTSQYTFNGDDSLVRTDRYEEVIHTPTPSMEHDVHQAHMNQESYEHISHDTHIESSGVFTVRNMHSGDTIQPYEMQYISGDKIDYTISPQVEKKDFHYIAIDTNATSQIYSIPVHEVPSLDITKHSATLQDNIPNTSQKNTSIYVEHSTSPDMERRLSFIEEVQLANKQLIERERQEYMHHMKKRLHQYTTDDYITHQHIDTEEYNTSERVEYTIDMQHNTMMLTLETELTPLSSTT